MGAVALLYLIAALLYLIVRYTICTAVFAVVCLSLVWVFLFLLLLRFATNDPSAKPWSVCRTIIGEQWRYWMLHKH